MLRVRKKKKQHVTHSSVQIKRCHTHTHTHVRSLTHAHTHIRAHMQPSNASSSSSSSSSSSEPLFRFFIYKVRNKIQKRIFDRNLFNYHLSLFSYFISFWKYFFSNNYSMMQSGKKKWHVSSESGRVDREKNGSGLVFFEALQKPIQSACPPIVPVQTLQMNFLSPVWLQTQSCRRGRDRRSCSFPLIHTNTAAEEPSLSDNSFLKHDRSLFVGTIRVHNSSTLWSDVKPVLIDFWTEILSLHAWLKPLRRQNASSEAAPDVLLWNKQDAHLKCSACVLFWLSGRCHGTLQHVDLWRTETAKTKE